ncbi:hypothetical protein SS1G_13707 [Sclerotinia sclerotiorum 1980 UF-70]|uniref:RING-type domain-containing protein n=2 Tax=Sclerotinia sclerotiorum (strain ATCC 18683 / 1980 / Ss-1) TaxID=665079 RepID=A0A1D9QJB0_SCLS1|nr:hypothetical protein SS1G_13707 [Sclerotinia sclerotiorum 1980 UF-70]APA14959.1 hypothetical protein sscle_14g097290 [Sclerotinia sclerotiorum 1980 UF-70]EDN98848.1 hypothetical protein SS1G_13707 [Sclerotinia sclerotiorum 1980 UF-70]
MSHSKRNTSRAVFTSHERELAKSAWTSSSARLSRDSFLPFASCRLCLLPARTPVSCSHGDIFCRECALSNILAQKKEIKRLEKNKEKDDQERNEDHMREEDEARQRAVEEFERVQMGLEGKTGGKGGKIVGREGGKILVEEEVNGEGGKRGEKRKFELDEDELLRIAQDERSKARKAIDEEKQDKPHNYSLHTLITVAFTEENDSVTKKSQRVCPSCKKQLTNTSKAVLAKPCGHVLCKSCVTKFMTPSGVHDPHAEAGTDQNAVACYVCEADLTERNDGKEKAKKGDKEKIKPGLVEIKSEGTGFASAGGNKVVKEDVAFQC